MLKFFLVLTAAIIGGATAMASDVAGGYNSSGQYVSGAPPYNRYNSAPGYYTKGWFGTPVNHTSSSGYKAHALESKCNGFMTKGKDADGKPTFTVGAWGKNLNDIISEPRYTDMFLKPSALEPFCPNFPSMDENQKRIAWIGFWQGLAQEESSCGSPSANTRNEAGMWQMEASPTKRAALHRGKDCADIYSVKGNAECSFSIMAKLSFGGKRHNVNDPFSYWGPVRRFNSQLKPHMEALGICYPPKKK